MAQAMLTGRQSQNPDLLSTRYPLNNSASKEIAVGIQLLPEQQAKVIISVLNKTQSTKFNIDVITWLELQNNFQEINEYFASDSVQEKERLQINALNVTFTKSYGVKSIVLDKVLQDPNTNQTKRRRFFQPAIVMQQNTFNGLKDTVACVQERYIQLQNLILDVEQCVQFISKKIIDALPTVDPQSVEDREFLKTCFTENADYKIAVKHMFNPQKSLLFIQNYFDIVYFELITFHLEYIINSITKAGNDVNFLFSDSFIVVLKSQCLRPYKI